MRRSLSLLVVSLVLICLAAALALIPSAAGREYGPPAAELPVAQVFGYSARLLWYDGLLTQPVDSAGPGQPFRVEPGETGASIAERLETSGLIRDRYAFRDYLIYTGLDLSIQAGEYNLSPALSIVDIAHAMQDATPLDVNFVILPGWRVEEIAAGLSTSGLEVTAEDFLASARHASPAFDFLAGAEGVEGFLFPDSYVMPRATQAGQLVEALVRNFSLHLSTDLREGFARQGLSVYQAVTLASIVQREAIHADESPLIASVFLNRIKINMKLDADPTVQYALGYDGLGQTWWTNPLSAEDLLVESPFNTYRSSGLPPAPISNPGIEALRAIAHPAETAYYYFRARCDASGYHAFAGSFEEQLQNACP